MNGRNEGLRRDGILSRLLWWGKRKSKSEKRCFDSDSSNTPIPIISSTRRPQLPSGVPLFFPPCSQPSPRRCGAMQHNDSEPPVVLRRASMEPVSAHYRPGPCASVPRQRTLRVALQNVHLRYVRYANVFLREGHPECGEVPSALSLASFLFV